MQDSTVFITGAAGTIGQACARAFLAAGARVALTDRAEPPSALRDAGNLLFEQTDATDPAAVERVFRSAVDRFGGVDAAVLAAGIEGPVAPVEEIAEPDLDAVLAVNLKGSLFGMQSALRHMKPRGAGSIVALSSISGVVGTATMAAYTMSKHAVLGLVRAAALEAGPHGVRVNAVCPGPVESEMMRRLDAALAARDPNRAGGRPDASRSIPLQRYVSPEEVAQMVLFLCGRAAGSCHGGAYLVDGGFTAR